MACSFLSFFDYTMDFSFQQTVPVYSWRAAEQCCRVLMLIQPKQLRQRALERILQGAQLRLKITSQADSLQHLECHKHPTNGAQSSSLLSTHMWMCKYWEPLPSSLGLLSYLPAGFSWICTQVVWSLQKADSLYAYDCCYKWLLIALSSLLVSSNF